MDKYERAAKIVMDYFDNPGKLVDYGVLGKLIKAEVERPEPLVPGVRYRNTEANRKRINDGKFYNIWDENGAVYIGCFEFGAWRIHSWSLVTEVTCFSILPDGEVQDE